MAIQDRGARPISGKARLLKDLFAGNYEGTMHDLATHAIYGAPALVRNPFDEESSGFSRLDQPGRSPAA